MTPEMFGTGGVGLALLAVILYLLRQNYADRKQYQDHIAEVEKRTADAIAEGKAESHAEISELRKEVRDLRAEVEQERRGRWKAEDEAAKYRRLHEASQPGGGAT